MPSSVFDWQGIPITGRVVCAAMAPARCAAIPAAAIRTPNPFCSAPRANSAASAGVRCAEYTCTSKGTSNARSVSTAFCTTGRSLSLPITIPTFFMFDLLSKTKKGAVKLSENKTEPRRSAFIAPRSMQYTLQKIRQSRGTSDYAFIIPRGRRKSQSRIIGKKGCLSSVLLHIMTKSERTRPARFW